MIEGNFKDVSLPGLLQFLATEVNKSYRVKVTSINQAGEIFVCKGSVTASSFGLLEGEDALCEFLSWREGNFGVELLNAQIEIKKNLHLQIQPTGTFADQSAFLNEQNIGLNSVLVASNAFGTLEWQESLRQQPLEKEDFVVLGWIGRGRSMRQALREFNFDIVKAVEVLFRLVATKSILVLRPAGSKEESEPSTVAPADGITPAVIQRFLTTGGQEAAAATVAQEAAKALTQEANAAVAQDAFVSTSFRSIPERIQRAESIPPVAAPRVDMAQVRASMETRLRARSGRNSRSMPGFTPDSQEVQASTGPNATILPADSPLQPGTISGHSSDQSLPPPPSQVLLPPQPSQVTLPPVPLRELLASQTENKQTLEEAIEALNNYSGYNAEPETTPQNEAPAPPPAPAALETDQSPPLPEPTCPDSAIDQNGQTDPEADEPYERPPTPSVPNAFAKLVEDELAELALLNSEAARTKTGTLPIVTLDIERLFQATFKPTQFGRLALSNPSLDQLRRQTLLDVEAGKSLTIVTTEGTRPPAAVLSSYRYCLDRGYIESNDPVIPLTADLLLGRVELDQYLLQRRRITGDELRDLTGIARKQGIRLTELLVRDGYLTAGDLETLNREQKRFAFK